jgi:molybdenum cofactor cytidylyltransferase
MHAPVDGIVLAGGRSTRMARPKPLLEVGSSTFLQRTMQVLREGGCRDVVVVVPAGAEWVGTLPDARVVANPQPDSEQIDSLRIGLQALPADSAAVLVLPVDLPLVSPNTAAALIADFRAQPAPLLLPFHGGTAGHPVLLARALYDEVLEREWEEGVRSLIMAHTSRLREVRVIDPGVLIDIDTPDDYWHYIERR